MFMRGHLWTPIDPAPVLLVALPFPKTKGEVGCKALSSTAEIKAFGNFGSLRQAVSRGLKLWT